MTDYCAFSKDHRCIKYEDYEATCFELEEAMNYVMATGLKFSIFKTVLTSWNNSLEIRVLKYHQKSK